MTARDKHKSIGSIDKLQRKSSVLTMTPEAVFTTLHFLRDLQMGQIS